MDPPRDQVEVLRAIFQRAADLHARFWCSPTLLAPSNSWLKGACWYGGDGRRVWDLGMRRGYKDWAAAKARFLAPDSPVTLSPKLVHVIDESFAATSWEKLQSHLRDPDVPFTLTHGDFHSSNMFLLPGDVSPSSVCLFDWSEVGPYVCRRSQSGVPAVGRGREGLSGSGRPSCLCAATPFVSSSKNNETPQVPRSRGPMEIRAVSCRAHQHSLIGVHVIALPPLLWTHRWEPTTDLAQLLVSDVKPEVFVPHSKALVKTYWDRLVSQGVDPASYPFDTCWTAFCRGGAERWIWLFVVIASFPRIPPVAVQYFHDQTLAFIEAHGDASVYELKALVCIE